MIIAFIFGMGVMAVLGLIYELVVRFQKLPAPTKGTKLIERILSVLFPPRLHQHITDWDDQAESWFEEQGSASPAKRKFTGIEKFLAEQRKDLTSH